jgi:quinol monooxygenase YgiN
MSTSRIHILLAMDIHDGKFSEFDAIANQMVAVTDKEPGALGYSFFLSSDRKHCRLVEGYRDVSAITAHYKGAAVQQFVPKMLKLVTLVLIEIYGDPGPEVTAMAAALKPAVFTAWHGFYR